MRNIMEEGAPVTAAAEEVEFASDAARQSEDAEGPLIRGSWYGKPVEEVDPLIFDDTFCVITKRFGKHYIHRYSCSKTLLLFGPLNPVRKGAVYLTTHHWFDLFIIFTIACNCVILAMITNEFDFETLERIQPDDWFVDILEFIFLAIFTVEFILKIVAKGFIFNRFAYLRSRWNILDFIVVASGFLTLYQENLLVDEIEKGNVDVGNGDSALELLRAFRVLRIVKTISIFPGLKTMINALLSSVVQLVEVMALTVVCLCIFSLFSLELFQGRLHQKCVRDKGGDEDTNILNTKIEYEDIGDRDRIWTDWVTNWNNWDRRDFPEDEPMFCGNGTGRRNCDPGYTCIGLVGDNPDDGWTSFDSFWQAMLSTFQLLTLDYWERLYDILLSTCGNMSMIFFMVVIFLGAYYLLNLMLAVVAMSYENEVSLEDEAPMSAKDRLQLNRRESNFSFDQISRLHISRMREYRKRTHSEREAQVLSSRKRGTDWNSIKEGQENQVRLDDAIFSLLGMKMTPANEKPVAIQHEQIEKIVSEQEIAVSSRSTLRLKEWGSMRTYSRFTLNRNPQNSAVKFAHKVASKLQHITPSVLKWQNKVATFCSKYLKPVVNHTYFEAFITICIVTNTIVLAIEHHGGSQTLDDMLITFNNVFMAVFSVECILKVMALQQDYFQSGWNIFDMIIVLVSYLDVAIGETALGSKSRGLSVIRSMRLLRVFKLAQSWVTMKVLLNIIFSSFGALGNLICVIFIILYIFAVMGMQVIGDKYTPAAFGATHNPSEFPQWNWRNFWHAFMMVFRVLCGEWIEPLWECLKAQTYHYEKYEHIKPENYNQSSGSGPYIIYFKCFSIFLPILIIGNFIVLNLFLALLLNSFDSEALNTQRDKELEAERAVKNIVSLLMAQKNLEESQEGDAEESAAVAAGIQSETITVTKENDKTDKGPSKSKKQNSKGIPSSAKFNGSPKERFKKAVNLVMLRLRIADAERAIARMENRRRKRYQGAILFTGYLLGNPASRQGGQQGRDYHYDQTPDSSDGSEEITAVGDCLPPAVWQFRFCPCRPKVAPRKDFLQETYRWENLRSACLKIVGNSTFEWTILALIFASSITLCFEDIHLEKNQNLQQILSILNYVFTGLFFVEMILKWIAIGIWGYFTSFWTILDGFIVAVSLVSLYFDFTLEVATERQRSGAAANLGALKALRTLRALRPLRAISRWEGMKIVVNALMYAIPSIFNVLLVCLLFWLIFSIMGVQFFKGQFYRCVDEEGRRVDWKLAPSKHICCTKALTHGYSWINTISNYDNVFEGYLSLLQIATFEGWIELMSYSVDATGVDKQPITDYQVEYYGFYVVFIFFGGFFTLQLFIGVIIDNFNKLKKKYEGNLLEMLLTPSQRKYHIAMKNLGNKKPRPVIMRPKSKFFGFFYDIAMSRYLEVTIFIMIFLNMTMEALENYGDGQITAHIMNGGNDFFTTVYFLEAFVKIMGLGFFYFTIPWNVYDFILVGASIIDVVSEGDLTVSLPIPPTMLRIVRVFRIGRILRLVKAMQGIRKLLIALVVSLPALFNIGALLALITFIYAILGMNLFGKAPRKWSIDDLFNFETFKTSNLMLLRLMTAAGWNEVLDSLTVIEPVCGSYRHIKCGLSGEPECLNRALVVAYMVSYLMLTYFIVINLYIAIILENYVEASNEEDVGIVEDDLEMFYVHWSLYDPHATQFINFDDLPEFLDSLNPPLQLPKPNIVALVAFNLPIARGNKIHCLDILQALIHMVLGEVDDSKPFRKMQMKMDHKFQKQFPTRRLLEIVSSTRRWKIEQNAAIIIQRAWRAYWKRKQARAQNPEATSTHDRVSTKKESKGSGGKGGKSKRASKTLIKPASKIKTNIKPTPSKATLK